MNNILKKQ